MRNLKRALSLGLASSMVLSTTAFSASAAMAKGEYPEMGLTGYTDHDQFSSDTNESQNAAFIAKQIDLMSGQEDGSFGVNDTLSRWQMAVIVTRMYFGDNFDVTTYPTTNADGSPVFNDLDGVVTEDIKRFIFAACDTGLIAGVGNGNFNPNGQVTLADALVMVLKAVGYLNINDKEWTTANNYQTFVTSLAYNLGLIDKSYVGNNAGLNEAMTREEIVVLVVRALTDIAAVSYNQAEQKYYNTFGLMNGTDDTIDNTDTYATLGFDRFKLEKHDVYDPFGRPSVTWIKDGYVLSNFVEEAVFETAEPVSVSTLYDYLGAVMNKYTAENFHYKIVVDGVEYSEWYEAHYVDTDFNTLGDHVSIGNTDTRSGGTFENFEAVIDAKNTTDFLASGHGALTQVYVLDTFDLQGSHIGDDDRKGEVIISVTNTHLGVISNYKENTDGTYTNYVEYLDDVMTTDTTSNTKVGLEYKSTDYQIITTDTFFDIGEVVSVKASGDDLIAAVDDSATLTTAAGVQADMSAIMINEPLTATGVVNQLDRYVYETGGVWLTLEGDDTDYYFNVANRGNVIDRGEMVPSLGANVKLYLEEFEGHKTILGYEIIEPESKYLYVEGVPTQGASYFVGVETKVTFDFGTEDNVYVTHVDGDAVTTSNVEDKIPSDNRLIDANGSIATANENFVVDDYNIVDETEFSQRIFRYEPYESNGQTFYKLYSLTNITENKANATYNSDEFDYDSNVMVNGKISTNEDIYYNIGNGINGTVGIFTSARYGDGIIDKSYDDKFAMSTVSVDNAGKTSFTNEDYIMLQGAAGETTAYGQTGEYGYGDARTGFNIIQGYGVYVLDMNPASDTKETLGYDGLFTGTYLQEGDATSGFVNVLKTDGTDSGFRIDEDHWTNNSANRDFAFLCDESTVFIDVVGGSATPATLAEVETLDSSDVNMQVIFGANGYADIVFINHGTNAEDISDPLDYFILKDGDGTVRTYNDDEGNQVHVYKVYVGGKETEMHLSSAAVATLGDNGLETNVLYYSVDTTGNDEIVDEVYFVVDYEPLRKVAYDINDIGQTGLDTLRADGTMSDATLALAYNNQWSVVTKQSTGTFTLSWKDTELYKGVGNTETTWADRTFTYDSETVFVAVTYGSGGLITDIRPTSSAALTVYSETNKNYPWVDVVSVKTNEYQKASLVTLLYPYDDGSSVESETDAAGIWFPEVPST
ncbi:MAG: S-layer homology domain-containing protein, partial [Eubacteriales bacterium]